jgi:DNA replication protein DnaC
MKAYEQTINLLNTLKLKGIMKHLDEILNDAEQTKSSYIQFLKSIFHAEIAERTKRCYERNLSGAHFPNMKKIETFEFGRVKGIGKSEVINLRDCHWIDKRENLLFFGPPGIGKTHLAIALGVNAIEQGYTVCFERMTNLIRLLKTMEIQRTAGYRIRRLLKVDLVIIDEIGYTPIEKREANLFFNLVTQLYEKSSIIITSNKGFDSWAEMMGDTVMTTALLDRLLHHSRIYNLDGDSYRIKDKLIAKEVNGHSL